MTRTILRILLAGLAFCAVAMPARATNYQDLWWNPNESGWGIQIVQQADTLFLTWFIYNNAGQPTWVVSDGVTRQTIPTPVGTAIYRGRVIAATGTFFGAPGWSAITPRVVGAEVTLTFTDARTATLTYTIDGTTVTKSITRQGLAPIDLSGFYYGGIYRSATGCTTAALNGSSAGNSSIRVTHANGNIDIMEAGGFACRFIGTVQQYGSIFEGGGTYQCAGDALQNGTWTGREGTGGESTFSLKLAARPASDGCTVNAVIGGFKSP